MAVKNYCVDTNVLLDDDSAIEILINGKNGGDQNNLYVPWTVLCELDGLKKDIRVTHRVARAVTKLDEFKKNIKVLSKLSESSSKKPNDDKILEEIKLSNIDGLILVTNDRLLRFKAEKFGIVAEPFMHSNPFMSESQKYTGFVDVASGEELVNNCFYWKDGKLAYNRQGREKIVDYDNTLWGLSPRTAYQNAFMELALDKNIDLITLQSEAGFGKTQLALAAALQLLAEKDDEGSKKYKKIFIFKPNWEIGNALGFLPGPQPLDAKVLTPTGWTTMGELKVGNYVIGDDGKPHKVLKIFDKGIKPIYGIHTTNGGYTEASDEHIWAVKEYTELKHKKPFKLMNTLEMKEKLHNPNTGPKLNLSLPFNDTIEFTSSIKLPLAPYSLGVFLGDGHIGNSVSFSSKDSDIIKRVESEIKELGCSLTKGKGCSISYTVKDDNKKSNKTPKNISVSNIKTNETRCFYSIGECASKLNINKSTIYSRCFSNNTFDGLKFEYTKKDGNYTNSVKNVLDKLGLSGKRAWDKFIPDIYKFSSIDDRISLLQGLMDTDGTIKKNGEQSITTISETLAKDIVEVSRSLGLNATYFTRNRIGSKTIYNDSVIETKHITFEVNIPKNMKCTLFHLKRKAERTLKSNCVSHNKIKNIEYVGEKETKCILIDSESHLYITNDFIVTHNTIDEKMEPYFRAIRDLVLKLHEKRPCNKIFEKEMDNKGNSKVSKTLTFNPKKFELLPINYIRGMTLENAIIIADEIQNLSRIETRSLLSRCGENVKFIITGDVNQIDNPYLNQENNGLNWVVSKMKGCSNYGHIVFSGKKSRGPIADMVRIKGL